MKHNKDGCECNFCHEFYSVEEGIFLYKKYFVCDFCFNVMELLLEMQFDSDGTTFGDISECLIETNLEELGKDFVASTGEKELIKLDAPKEEVKEKSTLEKSAVDKMFPSDIKAKLDEFVISQDEAKKVLSVAVYNHYLRLNNRDEELPKSNIILVGDSGTGKTHLVQTLARIINVPLFIADSPSYTQTGWKGNDVNDILVSLITSAGGDLDLAEKGIVYLDEIDKICIKSTNGNGGDINGEGVQKSLLKMVEGAKITVTISNRPVEIDTSNILFIGGGVFNGIDDIIAKRSGQQSAGIGFGSKPKQEVKVDRGLVSHEDIVKFGFMPEFMGRFAVIAVLEKLYRNDLVRILTEPKNAIVKQYVKLMKLSGIELKFEEDTLNGIADKAIGKGTGARGLKSILEALMKDVMYELPGSGVNKYNVTLDNKCPSEKVLKPKRRKKNESDKV